MTHNLAGRVALVTGASRGVGAAVAVGLAHAGADVVINYRSKGPRAEQVAAEVRQAGTRALLAQADITDLADIVAMQGALLATFGRLDILVLNASGGMEKDKPHEYGMQLNRDAQLTLLTTLAPNMPPGGVIVFVTSHWAHFYGQRPVYAGYEAVAASKHAGEVALREHIPWLAERGLRLLIVSGDVIEGTITPRLLERAQPGLLAVRRAQVGSLPTIAEFAAAIVAAAASDAPTGSVTYVGATD